MKITKEGRRIKIDISIGTANMLMIALVYSPDSTRSVRCLQNFLKSILVEGLNNVQSGDNSL